MATAAPAAPTTNGAAAAPRMSLASVKRKVDPQPDRILLVGTEGIGKTTFGAESKSPIFICAEDGVPTSLGEVPRFPQPETLEDVYTAIRELIKGEHSFGTLVVDTIDWLEPIVWREVCTRNQWADIESPGYGKGHLAAAEEWRKLLGAFDTLRQRKKMDIILLAHAAIRTFNNPAGGDYSRYECKLNKNTAAIVKEWCDVNLFAIHEEFVQLNRQGKETRKGISTGRRVIYTTRSAAWDAKNRCGLPLELPLNYADYVAARDAGVPADPAELLAEGKRLIDVLALDDNTKTQTLEWLDNQAGKGASTLFRGVDRLRSKVAEKGDL